MTPDQYVDSYHSLRVEDEKMKLAVTAKIEKYEADWSPDAVKRATDLLEAVATKCCRLRGNFELPATFWIKYDRRVDPTEEFYCAGIRRAYASRGSPAEMADALRLAVLAEKTTPAGAQQYAQRHFGQDCNSFVANYLGVSPMISIAGYVKGWPANASRQTPDQIDCQSLFPLPAREDPWKIAIGDVLVTFGPYDDKKGWWRHIALVQGLMVAGTSRKEGRATVRNARIGITEWGGPGEANHKVKSASIDLVTDVLQWEPPNPAYRKLRDALRKELPGKTLVGFAGRHGKGEAIRIFLDASSLDYIEHRGWHVRNWNLGH